VHETGIDFLVMEYVAGKPLESLISASTWASLAWTSAVFCKDRWRHGAPLPEPSGARASRGSRLRCSCWQGDIQSGTTVQLTSDPKFEETYPQWSPDGKTIAFTRHPAQSPNAKTLWLMDPDGANPRQILGGNNLTRWLPDGSGIVDQSLKLEIFLYDLATGRSRQFPTQPDVVTMPTRSPDGQWILYQATGQDAGNVDVHAVGLDGGQPRVVVSTPRQDLHPFFSPSGRWVYFQPDHRNLYRVPGPGQNWKPANPARMTDFPESERFLEDPQFSRDGKQLLYARGKVSGDIWILKRGE